MSLYTVLRHYHDETPNHLNNLSYISKTIQFNHIRKAAEEFAYKKQHTTKVKQFLLGHEPAVYRNFSIMCVYF